MIDSLMDYDKFRFQGIDQLYFNVEQLKTIQFSNNHIVKRTIIGYSFLNRPIYLYTIGKGDKNILLWGQMHGNETTGSRTCIDILNWLSSENTIAKYLLQKFTFSFIPILNPDGAYRYTRRNANNIDMNRDFVNETSVEVQHFKKFINKKEWFFCFNLHDQRSIFHVHDTKKPSTLSVLSPSINISKEKSFSTEFTKIIAAQSLSQIKEFTDVSFAKFDDTFYPLSFGDNLQAKGIPTLLVETGHRINDSQKNHTRKILFHFLVQCFKNLSKNIAIDIFENESNNERNLYSQHLDYYNRLPFNDNKARDIILRNINVGSSDCQIITDMAIQGKKVLIKNELKTIYTIDNIGELSNLFGWKEIDCKKSIVEFYKSECEQIKKQAHFKNRFIAFIDGIKQ